MFQRMDLSNGLGGMSLGAYYSDDLSYSPPSSICNCSECSYSTSESYASQRLANQYTVQRASVPKHRLIKWSLPPPPIVSALLPGWRPMPFGLESFWQSAFAWFFRPFFADHGHIWTLEPTDVSPMSTEWPWHSVTYSAKVRFLCPENHGWTSMKGRVSFWFRMRRQGSNIVCESLFRLFGQECSRCLQSNDAKEFVTPLWYPDEIENAFRFLSTEVNRVYYGGSRKDPCVIKRIRKSAPGTDSTYHHDPSRCQACLENQCVFATLDFTHGHTP